MELTLFIISVLSLLSSSGVGGKGRLGAKAGTRGDDPVIQSNQSNSISPIQNEEPHSN